MINLSPAAANEIKRLRSKQSDPKILFRLQVKSGGCSGWFYALAFDSIVSPSDYLYDCNGIPVVIDVQSLNYISNLQVDYSEDLMGGGFRFHNQAAIAVCSCGNSFLTQSSSVG